MAVACFLSELCAQDSVCVQGELGIVVGQIYKQTGFAGLGGARDTGPVPLSRIYSNVHDLQILPIWRLDKHGPGGAEHKEFGETVHLVGK